MTKALSQKQRHGPRNRVFAHLSRYAGVADTPGWTGKSVNTDGTTSSLPPKDELLLKSLDAGDGATADCRPTARDPQEQVGAALLAACCTDRWSGDWRGLGGGLFIARVHVLFGERN